MSRIASMMCILAFAPYFFRTRSKNTRLWSLLGRLRAYSSLSAWWEKS